MGLSQALSTGISGLVTHQKAMDNVGNNLANVNTVGFKKGVFQFRTLLEQTFRGGMGADATTGRGSINPVALGLGTQTGSINKVFTQGPLENTSNPNDMAIEGNGFFVLAQGTGYVYTRDGSFYIGADGSLMGGNGLFVQGTMAVKNATGSIEIPSDAKLENIIIPIGTMGGMSQTSQVQFKGNLNSQQEVATGLRLFGGESYPTVSNLQQWMEKNFNGGEAISNSNVDTTWSSLQERTFVVSRETLNAIATSYPAVQLPVNADPRVSVYTGGATVNVTTGSEATAYYALNTLTGAVVKVSATMYPGTSQQYEQPVKVTDLLDGTYGSGTPFIPVVEEVKTINGGNVQTSAAFGVKTPDFLAMGSRVYYNNQWIDINNEYTYPAWFYEDNGGSFAAAAAVAAADFAGTPAGVDAAVRAGWPNGFAQADWPSTLLGVGYLPRQGETYAAGVNTPLEELWYYKGNVWTQPYANIKNGDEITVSFKKGQGNVEATFVYNRPGPPPLNPPQQPVNVEQSYTLEHFLRFLAGDVDEPSSVCGRITPAMFGAPATVDFPDGDMTQEPPFDRVAYEQALHNIALATADSNRDTSGGVMGLLSLPPKIGSSNYGSDAYDAPIESAGAYSRTGISEATYTRWNSTLNKFEEVKLPTFNISLVSNLGSANAISDISISYNNVPHTSMFASEVNYAAPQGGSASATMTFYDSLGNPKTATVRLAMVSQDSDFTTWRWYADCIDDSDFPWQVDPNTGEIISNLNVGTGLIRFDKNGNYVKGAEFSESGGITINQANRGVNEPIWIKMLNGLSSDQNQDLDFSFMTMSAMSSDLTLKWQNGAPPGTLESFQVGLDGLIEGVYSNGVVSPIARLVLALIPNMNGLLSAGNNIFYTGPASGDAQFGYANVGGRGEIRQMQLETSNVDLSEEFTKLISVERGFQANSRTITTADEMLQELLNLKR